MSVFDKFGLSQELNSTINSLGFTKPTQIQEKSIPHIIAGKDVIGESATGSGKTLAFGCGIVEKVVPNAGLQALVLVPTRELAEQVKESLKELSRQNRVRVISVYGGVSINPQIDDLQRGAEIAVATPGRLLDHLNRRTINISSVKILVLDEADRMLDMGFIDDIKQIIKSCPKKRQTLFFSATISSNIKNLTDRYMNNPIRVSAVKMVDPKKLKQVYYSIAKNSKLSLLAHLLQHENSGLAMIFCNSRKTTDFVVKNLRANRISAIAIHGGFSQNKRSRTMQIFNNAKAGALICTDVAARGLHIENVSHVYNYEIPKDPKDYVHRIGRTARAGEEGKVVNFLCEYDYDNFSRILSEYREFTIEKQEKPALQQVVVRMDENNRRGQFHRQGFNNSRGQRPGFNSYRGVSKKRQSL